MALSKAKLTRRLPGDAPMIRDFRIADLEGICPWQRTRHDAPVRGSGGGRRRHLRRPLTDQDYIASTHRGHGHCIAKGCDVRGMALELFRKAGRSLQRQGRLDAHRGCFKRHARVPTPSSVAHRTTGLWCRAVQPRRSRSARTSGSRLPATARPTRARTLESMNYAVVLKAPNDLRRLRTMATVNTRASSYATGADMTEACGSIRHGRRVKVDGTDFLRGLRGDGRRAIKRAHKGDGPDPRLNASRFRWPRPLRRRPTSLSRRRKSWKNCRKDHADPLEEVSQSASSPDKSLTEAEQNGQDRRRSSGGS